MGMVFHLADCYHRSECYPVHGESLRAACCHWKPEIYLPVDGQRKKLGAEMIRAGVDAMICDDTEDLLQIMNRPEYKQLVRLADRNDNPFKPLNAAYSLTVYTADRPMAGTDAEVTLLYGFQRFCTDHS